MHMFIPHHPRYFRQRALLRGKQLLGLLHPRLTDEMVYRGTMHRFKILLQIVLVCAYLLCQLLDTGWVAEIRQDDLLRVLHSFHIGGFQSGRNDVHFFLFQVFHLENQ